MSWTELDIAVSFIVSLGIIVTVAIEMNKRTRRLAEMAAKQNQDLRRTLEAMMVLTDVVSEMVKESAPNAKRKKN